MQRRSDVLWRISPGFLAAARPGQDVTVVEGAAAHLWELAAEDISAREIAEALADFFDADVDQVTTEVAPIIDLLLERGLLEGTDGD